MVSEFSPRGLVDDCSRTNGNDTRTVGDPFSNPCQYFILNLVEDYRIIFTVVHYLTRSKRKITNLERFYYGNLSTVFIASYRNFFRRIYGELHRQHRSTLLIDSVVCTLLSERKLGPHVYGIFPDGRLEEFVDVSQQFPDTIVG